MCKLDGYEIGDMIEGTTTNSYCMKCQRLLDATEDTFIIKGHVTDGIVYDVFKYCYPRKCPFCNNLFTEYRTPCRDGGSFTELFQLEKVEYER